jgi:hypothetical protein
MQPNKSRKKIEQIEKVSQNPEDIFENLSDVIKRSGTPISNIAITLLLIPFMGVASVAALFKTGLNDIDAGAKNAYYNVKNNPKIIWRSLLILMAQQFKLLFNEDNILQDDINEHKQRIKALIFDDSPLEKTGTHIEGIGYVHDHVKNMHILGFKLLLCGFFDGTSFIPIDFYILRENRSDKKDKLTERIKKKQIKFSDKQTEIKELRDNEKNINTELRKAKNIYKKNPTNTNKNNLERKYRVKKRVVGRLKNKIKEKIILKTKIDELETQLFELKAIHCGLSKKQYKEQSKKTRDRNTVGYRRKQELDVNKIEASVKMIKRAVKKGFIPDYILTDTWFFCKKILAVVLSIGKGIHLVSMAKIGTAKYEILPKGKFLNPNQIITLYQRTEGSYSRKHKAKYIQFQANYQGVRVKIFLVQFGKHGRWRLLVTTDLKMSFIRIIEVYQVRWTIEVFFKESKQYLLLGKCQSQDFDAQIADITLSLIRYIFLSYYERIHYGMTIGEIFRKLSQASIKENLLADILYYFTELLKIFADNAGVDFIAFYEDLLRDKQASKIIERLGIEPKKIAA